MILENIDGQRTLEVYELLVQEEGIGVENEKGGTFYRPSGGPRNDTLTTPAMPDYRSASTVI